MVRKRVREGGLVANFHSRNRKAKCPFLSFLFFLFSCFSVVVTLTRWFFNVWEEEEGLVKDFEVRGLGEGR